MMQRIPTLRRILMSISETLNALAARAELGNSVIILTMDSTPMRMKINDVVLLSMRTIFSSPRQRGFSVGEYGDTLYGIWRISSPIRLLCDSARVHEPSFSFPLTFATASVYLR
jgi:hypothetical protein